MVSCQLAIVRSPLGANTLPAQPARVAEYVSPSDGRNATGQVPWTVQIVWIDHGEIVPSQNLHKGATLPFLECKATGSGELSGYGSVFGVQDLHGDIVRRGAFVESLQSRSPVMLWSHHSDQPIGKWTEAKEDAHGLRVAGQLNLATDRGKEAHALLKSGDVDGLSIGFNVPAGGIEFVDGVRHIKRADLFEVSLVTMPSNEAARVTETRAITGPEDLEQVLRHAGISRRAAQKFARGGWAQFCGQTLQEIEAELAAEAQAEVEQETLALIADEIRQAARTM